MLLCFYFSSRRQLYRLLHRLPPLPRLALWYEPGLSAFTEVWLTSQEVWVGLLEQLSVTGFFDEILKLFPFLDTSNAPQDYTSTVWRENGIWNPLDMGMGNDNEYSLDIFDSCVYE